MIRPDNAPERHPMCCLGRLWTPTVTEQCLAPAGAFVFSVDRGRSGELNPAPPSEPYGRFSRIRLSGQWPRCRGSAAWARIKAMEINPSSAK